MASVPARLEPGNTTLIECRPGGRTGDKGWLAISGRAKHQDGDGPGTEADRLDALKRRIRDAELHSENEARARGSAKLPAGAFALVGRIATELVAGVAVGGFVGWMLDNWLGTTPAFMIGLLLLGAGAGTMNIWRMASGHGLKVGYFDQDGKTSEDGRSGKGE